MAVTLGKAARKWAGVLIVALSSLVSTSFASPVISYTTSNPGGNNWVYQYTVSNPAPSDPIAEFTFWFDRALYTNLGVISSPADWDSIVIQSDDSIPADGFFDSLALGPGIGANETLTGFAVHFTFLGSGNPGAQLFDILDANFNTVFSGTTRRDSGPTGQVPEPGIAWLMLAAIIGFFVVSGKKRIRHRTNLSVSVREAA